MTSGHADIKVHKTEAITTVIIKGTFDSSIAAEVMEKLVAIETPVTVVDLSHTTYINSRGIGALTHAFSKAQTNDRNFCLIVPDGPVREVLSVVGALAVVPHVETAEELDAAFGKDKGNHSESPED
jgi:anti-anti-sigma factor